MQIINKIFKLFRCSVAGGRCVIARYLIAPGTVKRMLCNSHQLYVGIAHFFYVIGKRMCELNVIVKSVRVGFGPRMFHPGARVHFVDRERGFLNVKFFAVRQPFAVTPAVAFDFRYF